MSEQTTVKSVSELYKYLCEWCTLPREECACSSPDFVEHSNCGECGVWEPVDDLQVVDKPNTVMYTACPGCVNRV